MRPSPILLALLLLPLTACTNSWVPADGYEYPVFSDDGVGIAAVFMEFEERDAVTHIQTRGHSTQLLIKDDTGPAAPSAITGLQSGQVHDLFYMRSAGYVVLGRWSDQRTSSAGWENDIWFDKISVNGTVTPLGSGTFMTGVSCDGGNSTTATAGPLTFIPSPDGSMIAKFEAETTCSGRTMQLTFLDGGSGAVLDGPIAVPDLSPAGPFLASPVDLAWTEDDTFAVGYWGSSTTPDTNLANVFEVGETPQTEVEMAIDCFYPSTSSSYTGASGDSVSIDSDSGTLSVTNAGGTPLTFGCP